jgi:hypothetical protein
VRERWTGRRGDGGLSTVRKDEVEREGRGKMGITGRIRIRYEV